MNKTLLRTRIDKLLADNKVEGVKDILPLGHPLYQKVYRQLFNNKESDITYDVLYVLLDKYKDVSSDWLVRGEGTYERNKIVTPPTHRQDIHIAEGATAAISQSGEASVTPSSTEPAEQRPDIATMVNTGDTGAMCAMLIAQKDEIIRLKDQRIADLERELDFIHHQFSHMFPEVK